MKVPCIVIKDFRLPKCSEQVIFIVDTPTEILSFIIDELWGGHPILLYKKRTTVKNRRSPLPDTEGSGLQLYGV